MYLTFITFFVVRFDRHLLPVLPSLAIAIGLGFAGLVVLLRGWFVARPKPDAWVPFAAVGVIVALGLAVPPTRTVDDGMRYSSDERAEARDWIDTSPPAGSTVLVDAYSPFVDPEQFEVTAVSFAATAGGEPEQYSYVVIAEQGSGRLMADPVAFPEQVARFEERFGMFCDVAYFPDSPWTRVLAQECGTP